MRSNFWLERPNNSSQGSDPYLPEALFTTLLGRVRLSQGIRRLCGKYIIALYCFSGYTWSAIHPPLTYGTGGVFLRLMINRGTVVGKLDYEPVVEKLLIPYLQTASLPAKKNPALNQRGYKGKLASYKEGLKYCRQHTHPEGWGQLHQAIGNAHYFRGQREANPRSY